MKKNKGISMLEANILYLVTNILFITIGNYFQLRDKMFGLVATEIGLVLLPSIVFILIKKLSFKNTLRLNKLGFIQTIKIIIITIFTYPIAVFFQAIFVGIISTFKNITVSQLPMPVNGMEFIYSFIVVALLPGICEEVLFRGVIMSGYDREGQDKSIFITSLLFAMMHMTLANFIGPFILGLVFGIMVYNTNSLYASIIGHTTNNLIALLIGTSMNEVSSSLFIYSPLIVGNPWTIISGFLTIVIVSFLIIQYLLRTLEDESKDLYQISLDLENQNSSIYKDRNEYLETNKLVAYVPVIIVTIIFIYRNMNYVLH